MVSHQMELFQYSGDSVMPLRKITVDFREQRGVRESFGLQPCHCQVGRIPDAGRPEMRESLLPLF